MYRKWKGAAALGMAALIGFLMPMGTMMAAEEDSEIVQEVEAGSEVDSEADAADSDEAILDDSENAGEEEDAVTDENVDDEINADDEIVDDEVSVGDENAGDEVSADDENADEVDADDEVEPDSDGNDGIAVMSETEETAAGGEEVQANTEAPVITITLNVESCIDDQSDNINYKYINVPSSKLEFSASLNGTSIYFDYYLDENPGDKVKDNIQWSGKTSAMQQTLSSGKTYVLYMKAEANGQTVYARSCGIVVDTEKPKVTEVTNGGTCQEGTIFHVEDPNLESVTVNGQSVTLTSDGNYQVTEAGTTCMIIAKDKAGNETTCNVTVTARNLEEDGIISTNGTYSLKEDTPYQLGEGQWQVDGDTSVYSGDNTFYVGADSNYRFTKR